MQLTVDKMFLILGIISFPNLFFRGQYNVPLLIFFFACWQNSYKGFIMYLLILSWFLDVYLLFDYIAKSQEEKFYQSGQKGEVVLVVSIVVFVCKTILVIYLIIFEERCQDALKPKYFAHNLKKLFKFDSIVPKNKSDAENR